MNEDNQITVRPWQGFLALMMLCSSGVPATFSAEPFATPQPGRVFTYPRDHASHPEFRTEWWYITGHLDAAKGQRFGFQVTFFRQAGLLGDEHLHLAHCALLDAASGTFIHQERLNRAGWDAEASVSKLDVRNGNWSLHMDADETLHIAATIDAQCELRLTVRPAKPLVVFGKDGVSRKGTAPTAASHYLTYPRLEGAGSVRLGNESHEVKASAWMDHEFSSSQLDVGQVGWDWTAIQLVDGSEIMVYRMRRADGSSDPAGTTLAWIDKAGAVRQIAASGFSWIPGTAWTSPRTKARYPIRPRIEAEGRIFTLRPLAQDQELGGEVSGLPYWEGACDVLDGEGQVIGRGFLELAGYAGDLAGQLRGQR